MGALLVACQAWQRLHLCCSIPDLGRLPLKVDRALTIMRLHMLAGGVTQPLTPAELAGLAITAADFEAAVKKVQPSVRREGFATTPDVTWNDVGALSDVSLSVQILSCFHMHVLPGDTYASVVQHACCRRIPRKLYSPLGVARRQMMMLQLLSAGEGGIGILHHAAHQEPREVCCPGPFGPHGGAAVWPTGMWQDAGGQGGRERERCQLHLHQGVAVQRRDMKEHLALSDAHLDAGRASVKLMAYSPDGSRAERMLTGLTQPQGASPVFCSWAHMPSALGGIHQACVWA